MIPFHLQRDEDESGVSGTGIVAEGVVFSNGWCAMTWLTAHTSVAFYTSLAEVQAIHGHNGKTRVVMEPATDAVRDIRTVAGFVAGWWPGLEDGIDAWGDEDALNRDPRLLAAHRLLQRFPGGGET